MAVTEKTDLVEEAQGRLVEQFKGKPKIEALIASYAGIAQDLEAVWFQLLEDRWLDTAVGVQLDGLGQILNLDRAGRSDDDYRSALEVEIILIKCTGTAEEQIDWVLAMLGQSTVVRIQDTYPAAFLIRIMEAVVVGTLPTTEISRAMARGKPVGVNGQCVYYPADPFQFDSGLGFDQGHWGGVIV